MDTEGGPLPCPLPQNSWGQEDASETSSLSVAFPLTPERAEMELQGTRAPLLTKASSTPTHTAFWPQPRGAPNPPA